MLNRLSNYFKYVFFLRDNQQERCKVLYFKNTRNQSFMWTKFFYRYTHCMYHAFFNFFNKNFLLKKQYLPAVVGYLCNWCLSLQRFAFFVTVVYLCNGCLSLWRLSVSRMALYLFSLLSTSVIVAIVLCDVCQSLYRSCLSIVTAVCLGNGFLSL